MPSFGTRLRLMAKAAVGTFTDNSATAAFGMLSGITLGNHGEMPHRGTEQTLHNYSRMPWLRAVASRIGDAVATPQWRLFVPQNPSTKKAYLDKSLQRASEGERRSMISERVESGEVRQVTDHILLDALHSANSFQTGQSMRKITQIHLDLVGEAFWVKERNGMGAPIGFWPVPPHWIEETPTPDNRRFRVSFRGWQGDIPDTEILWMADPNPANPFARGSGLARTLADELETDEYAAKFTKQVFHNRARPDFIVWPEVGETTEGQRSQLRTEWTNQHQGFWRAFRPMFASKKVGIHEFKHDFQALQLTELRQHERDTIIQVFGFPPEILGVIENSNRSTIDAAGFLFDRYVATPRLEFLRTTFQERLVPEYDSRLILDYVSPVREDELTQLDAMKASPWAYSVDEWRKRGGQGPMEDGKGDLHAVPSGTVFVSNLLDAEGKQPKQDPASRPVAASLSGGRGD
jgi:HK97 family phage portal protein